MCREGHLGTWLNNLVFLKTARLLHDIAHGEHVALALRLGGGGAGSVAHVGKEVVHLFVSVAECEITGRAKASLY